jgi:hypothetical protein
MRTLSLVAGLLVLAGLVLMPMLPSAVAADPPPAGGAKGRVVFGGESVPTPLKLNVDKDQQVCLIKWAVVWLAADQNVKAPAKKMPPNPALAKPKTVEVVMDQPCCSYEPHVLAMRDDQTLVFKNSASVAHNVNYLGCGAQGNPIMAPGSDHKVDTKLNYTWTGMNVGCNIHGWMKAYVRVFDHPYFAVTDENGNFDIKDVPPGDYYLLVWHEGIGIKDVKTMTVNDKKVTTAGEPIIIKAGVVTKVDDVKIQPESK